MAKVKGKVQLCSCEKYATYFKSIQGLGNHTLFERYDAIENVVYKNVDEKYQHFLATPIIEGDSITWFSSPYSETPQRLKGLKGDEYTRYDKIKNSTLDQFNKVINTLKQENKTSEAESLEKAIKFLNDDFIYCFDGKTTLGVWGMQLKENVRESDGTYRKDIFVPKKKTELPDVKTEIADNTSNFSEPIPTAYYLVRFNAGEGGDFNGSSEFTKSNNELIDESEIPEIHPKVGYEFVGWDKAPIDYCVTEDTRFTAQYRKIPIILPNLPWYLRFWNWLKNIFFRVRDFFIGSGCLKSLLWLLLFLLLLFLLIWLFRGCNGCHHSSIVDGGGAYQDSSTVVGDDPNSGRGGIYNPGDPYNTVPTPPAYHDVLPPDQGVLPPIDSNNIIRKPGKPVIVGNRLNILMENEDKSIMDLAKEFKEKYPDNKYKVVYYDDVVKRMQIEFPEQERANLKQEIPAKFAQDYKLFVFDEAMFGGNYTPNDPAFSDPDKSWYLKTIQAPQAWDITRGSSKIKVAIVDNGFSLNHSELNSKVIMPYNVWTHSKDIFPQQVDHGTHVAGTALAIMNNSIGICGIAPECAFMPIQVANRQGLMTTTSILDGILYALYQGADVINVSLGTQFSGNFPDNEQLELQNNHFKEEERLWKEIMKISGKHSAIIVMAAGNENMLAGVDPMKRPKGFVVVSATDKNNRSYQKAGFSNFGEYSTISAPGVDIYSTIGANGYTTMSGTSMAAPIVTGTIALMKSLNKNLTSEQVICILQSTGVAVDGNIGNLIQVDKALQKEQTGVFTDCDSRSQKPSNPNTSTKDGRRDSLQRERERVQRQLNDIDQQLKNM